MKRIGMVSLSFLRFVRFKPDFRSIGCPNRDVEYESNVTLLGYRLHNATVPRGCYDIDLVIEYMDGWNTPTGQPPKCWPQN
jgi:hypothetical protein